MRISITADDRQHPGEAPQAQLAEVITRTALRRGITLVPEECEGMCHVAQFVRTVDDSRALDQQRNPAVIIAASGMATGGRVVRHLKALAPNPINTLLMPGFQAGGTRGAQIVAGAPSVRIHGQDEGF
jgi:metallo-beta-lactamase family protein